MKRQQVWYQGLTCRTHQHPCLIDARRYTAVGAVVKKLLLPEWARLVICRILRASLKFFNPFKVYFWKWWTKSSTSFSFRGWKPFKKAMTGLICLPSLLSWSLFQPELCNLQGWVLCPRKALLQDCPIPKHGDWDRIAIWAVESWMDPCEPKGSPIFSENLKTKTQGVRDIYSVVSVLSIAVPLMHWGSETAMSRKRQQPAFR